MPHTSIPRSIKPGVKFIGSSLGKPEQLWVVTQRAKTLTQNNIWCECKKTGQRRKYNNRQFHKLLTEDIIQLVKRKK